MRDMVLLISKAGKNPLLLNGNITGITLTEIGLGTRQAIWETIVPIDAYHGVQRTINGEGDDDPVTDV